MSFLPPSIRLPINTPTHGVGTQRSINFPSTGAYASSPNYRWNASSRSTSTLSIPSITITPHDSYSNESNIELEHPPHIAQGSYWTVYPDKSNSSKVIRIGKTNSQKNRNVRATAKRKSNQFFAFTKNNRLANQELSFNELPNNLQQVFTKQKNSIQAIRTPHLGIDLLTYVQQFTSYMTPDIKLDVLLTQYHILLRQTFLLSKHHMCHGDIHLTNLMIKPDTLELHLIDFDLLDTFEHTLERLKTGSAVQSWIPPEYLRNDDYTINKYVTKLYETYTEYYTCNHITKDILRLVVAGSMRANQGVRASISHYDNFGLGMSLLYVLTVIYQPCAGSPIELNTIQRNITALKKQSKPISNTDRELDQLYRTIRSLKLKINNNQQNEIKSQISQLATQRESLSKRARNEYEQWKKDIDEKEREIEQRAIAITSISPKRNTKDKALYDTIELLEQLCDFRISSRISPAEAYQRMTHILLELCGNDLDKVRDIRKQYEEDTRKSGGKPTSSRRRTIRRRKWSVKKVDKY
jgi:prefoldin subunit 5